MTDRAVPIRSPLFVVKGKVAIITGASGAFGAVAARCWPPPARSSC